MRSAIKVDRISKSYKEVQALKETSFEVSEGEIFGLIGPDGAGKTTLIRIAATLLKPDTGQMMVAGFDSVKEYQKVRDNIGYVPGKFSLYQDLTVEENLNLFATIFATTLEENYHLIKDVYVMLEPFKKRRAGQLSGGMKQKLALSCALIHKPKVLLLDEPTTGVDPVSRKEFWEMLGKLKDEGITILVSTPYMDEAARCDRVALIQNGKILSIDKPESIRNGFPKKIYSINSNDKVRLLATLRNLPSAYSANLFGDAVHYIDQDENTDEMRLAEFLGKENFSDVSVKKVDPQIEDCFMDLMQGEIAH